MMRAASLGAEITNKVKERVKEGSSGTVTGEGGGRGANVGQTEQQARSPQPSLDCLHRVP